MTARSAAAPRAPPRVGATHGRGMCGPAALAGPSPARAGVLPSGSAGPRSPLWRGVRRPALAPSAGQVRVVIAGSRAPAAATAPWPAARCASVIDGCVRNESRDALAAGAAALLVTSCGGAGEPRPALDARAKLVTGRSRALERGRASRSSPHELAPAARPRRVLAPSRSHRHARADYGRPLASRSSTASAVVLVRSAA